MVRELEQTMEHAFVLCSQNVITFDHLPPDFMSATGILIGVPLALLMKDKGYRIIEWASGCSVRFFE
jgi:hypothetical protein